MAPSFNDLAEDNGTYDSEDELDFSGMAGNDPLKFCFLTFGGKTSEMNMMFA